MTRVALLKLAVAAVGFVVWAYGARIDSSPLRLAGMIVIAVAVALRLLPATLRDRIDGRAMDGDRSRP